MIFGFSSEDLTSDSAVRIFPSQPNRKLSAALKTVSVLSGSSAPSRPTSRRLGLAPFVLRSWHDEQLRELSCDRRGSSNNRSPSLTFSGSIAGRARYGGDGLVGAVRCRRRPERLRRAPTKPASNPIRGQRPQLHAANLRCEQFRSHQVWAIAAKALRETCCPICGAEREIFGPFQEFLIDAGRSRWSRRRPLIQACGTRPATSTFNLLEKIDRPAA